MPEIMTAKRNLVLILVSIFLVGTTQAFLVWQPSPRKRMWIVANKMRRSRCGAPNTVSHTVSRCGFTFCNPSLSSASPLVLLSLSTTCLQAKKKPEQQDDESSSQSLIVVEDKGDSLNVPLILQIATVLSLLTSAGTLWSEVTVYQTGCGPLFLPDVLERVCYQAVLFVASAAWFIRIVFRQGLAEFLANQGMIVINDDKDESTTTRTSRVLLLVRLAEAAAYLAVLCAFGVLWNQMENKVQMDGLSGIDIAACKARRDFLLQQSWE